ncbi:MAG: hypothetical protein JO144_01080, partial [Actinobacteria bacterium]|nr:hypothetical protein [Actinomycetota bacterium]
AVHLLDTRVAPVRTLAANSVTKLTVAGLAGIPAVADGLGAVALNLRTVHQAGAAGGYLKLWPSDQAEPGTSNINYTSDTVYRTDLAIVAPAADGSINVRNGGAAPIDLVLDVEGWFADPGPGIPVVRSSNYPRQSWTPPGGAPAVFTVTDSGTGTPATRFSYHLDDAPPADVTGSAISFTPPTTPGEHTLSVVATDRYGVASPTNVYAFNIGAPPAAPTGLAVTAGAGSADLTWTAGTDNGASTLGYTFAILDRTTAGAAVPLGSCSICTHFVLTGLDPTHSYAAQVAAVSPAGDSTASTSGDFTAAGSDPISCPEVDGTDDTCASQDITKPADLDPLDADYDQSGTDADTPVDTTQPLTGESDPPCTPDTSRTGPWTCSVPDSQSSDDPSAFGSCNINYHCYGQSNNSEAHWHGTIYYGWNLFGERYTIGSIYARAEWVAAGAWIESETFYTLVGADHTRDLRFTTQMFNGSPTARHGGSPVPHTKGHSHLYSYAPAHHEFTYDYWEYDDEMWDHNFANQITWSAPGYPGYFIFYVRSPSAHTSHLGMNAWYYFRDPTKGGLPQDTWGSGHRG